MPEQAPSIGRVVHYVATNGAHVPADICGVFEDGTVNLFVKDSTIERAFFTYSVPMEPTGVAVGSWHWPEYVAAVAPVIPGPIDLTRPPTNLRKPAGMA